MEMLLQELEVWYVIPSIRRELAGEMLKRGIKNVEIAKRLGLTKSAISQYSHNVRAREFKFSGKIKQELKKSVDRILEGKSHVSEIQKLLKMMRKKEIICKFHGSKENINLACDLCFRK